ncbi:MAG: BREX-1 system adenine-specific DNA-methyltransferase PglX, partial [Anaerovoracaceae bacterium]
DPCMGSGHILVYAFDVLMQIYESEGYNPRDATKLILKKNIYGLDIDRRAYQLAYFSLMMKARQYNRRIFTDGVKPQIYHPAGFLDGEEYGSLVKVDKLEPMPEEPKDQQMTLFDGNYDTKLNAWNFKRLLAQKYDVVVTNPPYMGGKGQSGTISEFLKNNYPDSKSDTFSAFIERCGQMAKPTGYVGMFTPYVWMFIQSYEKLRNNLYSTKNLTTLIQFEYSAFEEATVPVCSFVYQNRKTDEGGGYFRLVDFRGGMEVQRQKYLEAIYNPKCGFFYTTTADNFSKIPGSPVAYWVSDAIFNVYSLAKPLSEYAEPKQGTSTGDNNIFLRLWHEAANTNIELSHIKGNNNFDTRWYPATKGGEFRKWYGNNDYIVDWQYDGQRIANHTGSAIRNRDANFLEALTWTGISSKSLGIRYNPTGFVFTISGKSIIGKTEILIYLLGLLCSVVTNYFLNITSPTMSFEVGYICGVPIIWDDEKKQIVIALVNKNIALSRADWDAFETSWDFQTHPLVKFTSSFSIDDGPDLRLIKNDFKAWECESNVRFTQLKANEEELNRIFIDIYGLSDELTPEVEDKDVTVRRADLGRDIRSLISYAVGCMFGRYSLDTEGLVYAGGDWDVSKYRSFIPDKDNILPICDKEYFGDDILGRFVDFIRVVYGAETLEENLEFIADALGKSGTPREVIRNYLLNDFYKDHCKIYKKRPIYWLFDSGRQNGLKALVYMHRYDEDTIGNLRIDYLHRMQRIYENEILRMQDTIDNSRDAREVTAATKRKEKLIKQLQETKEYDEKIAHLALARISIDLDDGVKVNYEKVQTDQNGKKLDVLAKI